MGALGWMKKIAVLLAVFAGWACLPAGEGARADGDLQWAWMKGTSEGNQPGIYGTKGMPATTNAPGGRYGAVSWTETSGTLWLFGGLGYDGAAGNGCLNDLWKYDVAEGNWTWMKGYSTGDPIGTYGTLGVSHETNTPGGRFAAGAWTDSSGGLWLFGGYGYDGAGSLGFLNDLWKYDPATGNWTWMKGLSTVNQPGSYGTLGTPDPANTPGARRFATSWTDGSGALWLFGGTGYDSTAIWDNLNDLWKYNPATGNWAWMKGSSMKDQFGTYGVRGTPNPANTPGARYDADAWTDGTGMLWLFGGHGLDGATGTGYLNDLWKYDPTSGDWTWMKGASIINQSGTYGTQGTPHSDNTPGARASLVSWSDSSSSAGLWLFGGYGHDAGGSLGELNDLWKYEAATGNWTWRKGPSTVDDPGSYGVRGTPASANMPGARDRAVSWSDSSGAVWLFGGHGYYYAGSMGFLNDLWRSGTVYTVVFETDGTSGATVAGETTQAVFRWDDCTTVTAVAPISHSFDHWDVASADVGSTNPLRVVDVNNSTTYTAVFLINTYTLEYAAGANGTISGDTLQTVTHGSDGSPVTAVPHAGYHFVQWSDGVLTATRRDTNVTGHVSVTASFEPDTSVKDWPLH